MQIKSQNLNDFIKIYLNSKIQEGLIDIRSTPNLAWRDTMLIFF